MRCFRLEGNCTYKDTSSARWSRALATKALNLTIGLHLVILEDCHLDLLALVLNLFGGLYTKHGLLHQRVTRNRSKHTL